MTVIVVIIVVAALIAAFVYHKSIVAKIRYEIAVANTMRASAQKAANADLAHATADIEDLTKKV